MVELTREISLPMRGWECDNCSEPFNSKSKPDQHMCAACRRETVWKLPGDARAEITDRLANATEGDQIAFVPDRAASLKGIVSEASDGTILLDKGSDDPRIIEYETDVDSDEDPSTPRLFNPTKENDFGQDIYHVEVTPEEDVEIDPRVTKSVKTPIDEIVHDAATHVDFDPDTVDVESVRFVDGELELKLRGEA